MKICIIAEGSYPYVMGGVSTWIQMLISSMPEHEFIIYAIAAEEKSRGAFKYKFPQNVIGCFESFLDEATDIKGVWGKKYKLDKRSKDAIKDLISGQKTDWDAIFGMVNSKVYDNVINFLMSRNFFDIVEEASEEYYSQISFTELYWTIRAMLLPLLQLIDKDLPKADLYHCVSTGYAGIIGSLAKYLYGKPLLLTEHGIYSREREEEIIKADWLKGYFKEIWIEFFYSLSQKAYDSSDLVISLYSRNKEIQIELGCDPDKISVIPNGVDFNGNKIDTGTGNIDGYVNIGALIRIVPIKDIKTMIHGFAMAKAELPDIRLYLMGPMDEDNDYYLECVQIIESMDVKDIIFTGMINPKDYMNNIDIIILTSISEAQPFAILEGFGYMKPAITTDVGSCRELIEGINDSYGDAGIVVPVMDYEKIGNAIMKLCQDTKLRMQMGQNGYRRAIEYYSIEKFIENYRKIYAELEY